MIPQDKLAAVRLAVQEAFGTATIEDQRSITKGLSSDLVFRIVVKGNPFLLKIMTRINEQMDPVRIFNAMRVGAAGGVAPRVWYANAQDGISIRDFVQEVPLSIEEALHRLPGTLRTLHALPAFPKAFNLTTVHNGFIWRFRDASLLPVSEIEEAFRYYAEIGAIYPRLDADMVSCHNDLKPENILFDGDRVWLVDWQAAFVNDRYFDLAIVANFVLNSEADEKAYLCDYFGTQPDEYQLARFFLMRQILHMWAAAVFLLLGSLGRPVDRSKPEPGFEDFHRRIWAGEINLAESELRVLYGRVHWERFLQNAQGSRFREALKIVAAAQASPDVQRLLPAAP